MSWYYAQDNKPVGPVEDEAFERLVSAGVIQPGTLVWREGMPDWQPLAAVRPRQPGQPTWPLEPEQLVEAVLARGTRVPIGDALSRAWGLMQAHLGPMVGTTLLVYLAMIAGSLVPFVGSIAQLVLQGPLMAGLYWYHLKLVRGETATVKDGFAGFGPRFVPAMLTHIVTAILAGLCLVPFVIALFVLIFSLGRTGGAGPGHLGAIMSAHMPLVMLTGGLFLVSLAATIYVSVCWIFALILTMDKGLNFRPAMRVSRQVVRRQWWRVWGLVLVAGLVGASGVILCGIGVVVTLPIAFSMLMVAYADLFAVGGGS